MKTNKNAKKKNYSSVKSGGTNKIVEAENPKDDFSNISIKTINVFEFDAEVKNQNENKIKND